MSPKNVDLFFEIGIISLFLNESFQTFVWLYQNDTPLFLGRFYI